MSHRTKTILAAAALLVAACQSNDPVQPALDAGEFDAQVTGATTKHLIGAADFDLDVGESEIGTAFLFSVPGGGDELAHAVNLWRWSNVPLEPGVYAVVEAGGETQSPHDFTGGAFVSDVGGDDVACWARSGTLEIDAASPGEVQGAFVVTASCVQAQGEGPIGEVTVTGRFHASAKELGA